MLKTMKSKVIAGAVTVGLLSGGGVVLGTTDAGVQLKGWYDSKFKVASTEVATDTLGYAKSKIPGLTGEYNGLKSNTTSTLEAKGESDAETSSEGIDKKSKEYIDQINKQKAEIESYLSSQFDGLSLAAKGAVDESGKQAVKYANSDLTSHANAAGKEAIADVTVKVENATVEAAKKLTDTIENAKKSLQDQLAAEQKATTTEIKTMIDAEISRLRTVITATNIQLIAKQEQLITSEAEKLLAAGKADLEVIVGNIKK